MLKKFFVVFLCLCWGPFFSQEFYGVWYGTNANILNKIGLATCTVQPLPICQPTYEAPYSGDPPYLDIAVDQQYLYSVTPTGVLYRQNLSGPLNCQTLGSFGVPVNALVADSAGSLYAIGKDAGLTYYLLKYAAGNFSNLGPLPNTYWSAGDLFFYNYRLFFTCYVSNPNPLLPDHFYLMDVDMNNPSQSCIYMPLPLPPAPAYWGTFSFWDGTLSHVFTQVDIGIQEIDMKCKTVGPATCMNLSGGCRGFASWYPFTSSNAVPDCSTTTVNLVPSSTQLCQGQTATLTANGWGTYTWSVPGSQSSITVTPLATTVYSIVGTDTIGCAAAESTTLFVNPTPTLVISGPAMLCAGSAITLSVTGALSYAWSTGASSPVINSQPLVNTVYAVTGTGANGCAAGAQISVMVSECLGLEKRTDKISLIVFPNPGRGPFEVVSDVYIREATVVDELAWEVINMQHCGSSFKINGLNPGIYFLRLSTGTSTISIKLLVLE